MPEVSFIIVNYNVTELLQKAIESIITFHKNLDYEIIVVDNASADQSWMALRERFPAVRFLPQQENLGFAKANNLAAKKARGRYLYLLNPDTELQGDYVEELIAFADKSPKFGCLGLRMHDAAGRFLPESKRAVPGFINSFEKLFASWLDDASTSYYRNDIAEETIASVEVITGANLLIQNTLYQEIGGLDERYFMYGEDIDLCYTLIRKGYTNWYYGKYAMLHHKGESTVKDAVYLRHFYGAMRIFLDKYYKNKPVQYQLLRLGLFIKHRMALLQISNSKKKRRQ